MTDVTVRVRKGAQPNGTLKRSKNDATHTHNAYMSSRGQRSHAMPNHEKRLRDQATFVETAKCGRPSSEESLGDNRALHDQLLCQGNVVDDIKVVPLTGRNNTEGAADKPEEPRVDGIRSPARASRRRSRPPQARLLAARRLALGRVPFLRCLSRETEATSQAFVYTLSKKH
jgi:hypothetical protein